MNFDKLLIKTELFVKTQLKKAPKCHDWEHTLRVYKNAILIAETADCDLRIVKIAALLHDISRPEELAEKGKVCHAKLGAEVAKEFLLNNEQTAKFAKSVSYCIRTHRFRDGLIPSSIDAKIIYDADKLDSIGAIGIGRAFHFAGREGAKVHNSKEDALSAKEYSNEDSAYREYLVKLSKLKDKFLTKKGKELAIKRIEFMDSFFSELNIETGLN